MGGVAPRPRCAANPAGAEAAKKLEKTARVSAKMQGMAGRPRALTAEQEHTLEQLVDAGIPHATVARAMGVSRRTVVRVLARRRAQREPQTLDELLASIETDAQAILAKPPRSRATRRRGLDWRTSARFLELNYPKRWGGPLGRVTAGRSVRTFARRRARGLLSRIA
jgi:hypothetical protein